MSQLSIDISIIIPAYNYALLLSRAIDSVMLQITDNVELLVINDGSTDNTREVLSQLEKKYESRFRSIEQDNKGLSATRNLGIDNTSGRYLMFLDADDELCSDAIANLNKLISSTDYALIIGGHISVSEPNTKGLKKEKYHPAPYLDTNLLKRFKNYIDKKIPISNGATLIKREVFSQIRYNEEFRNSEDIPVFGQILVLFDCFSYSEAIARIHKHSDSLRHNQKLALDIGTKIVSSLFDKEILPQQYFRYKNRFYAQRCLSLFRTLYLNEDFLMARKYYIDAILSYPLAVARFSYLRKFIRSYWYSQE